MEDMRIMDFLQQFDGQLSYITSEYVIRIGIALVALLIGYIAVKVIKAVTFKVMTKLKMDDTLQSFLKSASVLVYYIILFMIVLTIAGVPSTYFAGILVGLGTAVGFGLRDEFKTVSNGIIILTTKPFKVGDAIKLGEHVGSVIEIKLFHTEIRTFDNLNVIISNGNITSSGIVKLSDNDTRRQDIMIDVSYGDDITKVKSVLTRIIENSPLVLKEPVPLIALSSYEGSSIRFMLRIWSLRTELLNTKFSIYEEVKREFDKEGITIPFQQHDINIKTPTSFIGIK